MRTLARVSSTLLLLALAGCGTGDRAADQADERAGVVEAGISHIHGVGINPADGAVIVATHSGLFRAARGQQRAERIDDRRQDIMGFTVVGPDSFLGSGHPDPRDDLPPLLGLIRSDDAGRSWEPVSLLGQADFHVLRAAAQHVYGVNSAEGALLASDDSGRSWQQRTPPGPVLDLAIDPRDARRIVVSTEQGLFVSPNGGRGWRALNVELAGLLAWTDALVLVDADGTVHASGDGGRSFRAVGDIGGQPAALSAHDGELLIARHDNTVHSSTDGGRTWTLRVRPG